MVIADNRKKTHVLANTYQGIRKRHREPAERRISLASEEVSSRKGSSVLEENNIFTCNIYLEIIFIYNETDALV